MGGFPYISYPYSPSVKRNDKSLQPKLIGTQQEFRSVGVSSKTRQPPHLGHRFEVWHYLPYVENWQNTGGS
jgi:hypothetical protein